ncbi:MAG: sigma-70 family RNA polymerase sigma factor [Gemmatimonadota bacterium]
MDDPRAFFERELPQVLPNLYGAALRLAKNPNDAEDLVACTVAKAWQNAASLKDARAFRAWLLRIQTNEFISQCRSAAGRVHVPLPDDAAADERFWLFERMHQPFLLWSGNPEQEFLDKLMREDLERAVDALPEAFRVVVVLVDLQEMSYAEVAETLDIPIGTVRSRLARGRALLQRALWQYARVGAGSYESEVTP